MGRTSAGPSEQRALEPGGVLPSAVLALGEELFLLPRLEYLLCYRVCSGGGQLAPGSNNSSLGTQ